MKLPWEKDPNDREANYRRPVPRADIIRLGVKTAIAVTAGLGFRLVSLDGKDEGAKLVAALGVALLGAGIADLVYMRTNELEQIFLKSVGQQRLVAAAVAALGLILLVVGGLAWATVSYSS